MQKNVTPFQISLYSAMVITALGLIELFFFRNMGLIDFDPVVILPYVLLSIITTYSVMYYSLNKYIYRKIKLIYKTIYRHKIKPEQKGDAVNMRQDVIARVGHEVEVWTKDYRQEMESLNKLEAYRKEYIGNVSHELKTPIFNIIGYLESLQNGAVDNPELRDKYLSRAVKNSERLKTIVDDLEIINKLEYGKKMSNDSAFDIYVLISEVFDELEYQAQKANITLQFKEGAADHFKVVADREDIRTVLINLILNSIRYGTHGGVTKVSLYDMDKQVLVEVADNGLGIEAKHLPHLFDRFYTVDKSRSREVGGSGLGLAIVKHIIEAQLQTINVRSSLQEGSTFGFTLKKA